MSKYACLAADNAALGPEARFGASGEIPGAWNIGDLNLAVGTPRPGDAARTGNVYLIDDDAAACDALYRLLSAQSGLVIRRFASGDAFLAEKNVLGAGVVLIEQDLPGITGIDVLRSIGEDPRFVTIFITRLSQVALAVRAMKEGAFDFLPKPWDAAQIPPLVDAALAQVESNRGQVADAEGAQARLSRLSRRERDVLMGLIAGHRNKVIARELGISTRTVEIYRGNMMEKLGASSLVEALRIGLVAGLVADS